jgi:hypothetical protein
MAPNVGSSPRRIHRRISGYGPADGTQVTEPQASKMWNYFFPGPLLFKSRFAATPRTPAIRDQNRVFRLGLDSQPRPLFVAHRFGADCRLDAPGADGIRRYSAMKNTWRPAS